MCVALILILNNFYKYYDTILEYCEHLTAAVLLVAVVSLILTPVLFLSYDDDNQEDENSTRPFIAIAVLVCGVIGGLIMVISFIFFCKYCFKKKQPLASAIETKRQEEVPQTKLGKHGRGSVSGATGRRGYEVLSGANSVVHPIPADLEAYLQQPASTDNNNTTVIPPDITITSTALIGSGSSKKVELLQKKLTKLAEEQLLIVQTEIEDEYDEDPTLAQVSDSNLVSAAGENQEEFHDLFVRVGARRIEKPDRPPSKKPSSTSHQGPVSNAAVLSGQQDTGGRQRSASSVQPRQHHRAQQVGRRLDTLAVVSAEEGRRRSFDERLSSDQSSQRRRSPVAAGADYYASEYDRKHSITSPGDHPRRHPPKPALSVPPPTPSTRIDYQQPQRRPAHLPRSHQMIVDKTSPPPVQQTSSTSSNGIPTEAPSKMYTRDHRNAVSYGAAEQDFSTSEKNMYARGHRLAFSFTDTGAERTLPPPHMVQHRDVVAAATVSPDRRSTDMECASFSSAFEYESLEKFCRECRVVFQAAAAAGATTTTSSSSSGHQHRNGPTIHLPRQRQVKSLDMADPRRAAVQHQRQVHSLDASCIACMNDAMNRLALLGPDKKVSVKLQTYAVTMGSMSTVQPTSTGANVPLGPSGAVLKRQLTLIESAASCDDEAESELMNLDDAQSEQVKEECKQLWNLRSAFESEPDSEPVPRDKPESMIIIDDEYDDPMSQRSMDAEELERGATTSYTTSFESNTEPITIEDYLRSRPSGPYLEPPRLTVEAKRQKLRSLYARRQMQLQQQGASLESYESVDTVDSSSSGKPELILTSTESNQEHIGALRDPSTSRPTATDQQQTSLSFDSSIGDADSQAAAAVIVATRPSIVRGSDYLTPSPSAHRRRIETRHTPSRERRAVEAFFDVVAASGNGADSAANGTETDCSRSDALSGESFDDGGGAMASSAHQPMPIPPPPYPNVHLFRMRRQYENGMNGGGGPLVNRFPPPPPPPQVRDYCVDSRTEAVFREFVRFDPRMEGSTGRGGRRHHPRRFQYHFNGGGASYDDSVASSGRGKLTQENSIDEDPPQFGTTGRYDIPVIRLPEDDVPPTQHRPQLGTPMAAKG